MALNCAALTESLLENELFGHARGAFTGAAGPRPGLIEHASGGTLFLDEIGTMPKPLQAKLLRALEAGEVRRIGENETRRVDVRFLAATNLDIQAAIDSGDFRSDLFYRLNVHRIHLPPLRERGEDLATLIEHFIRRFGGGDGDRLHRVRARRDARLRLSRQHPAAAAHRAAGGRGGTRPADRSRRPARRSPGPPQRRRPQPKAASPRPASARSAR